MAAASFDRSESSAMIKLHPDGRTPDNIPVYVLQVPVAVLLKVRSPWGGGGLGGGRQERDSRGKAASGSVTRWHPTRPPLVKPRCLPTHTHTHTTIGRRMTEGNESVGHPTDTLLQYTVSPIRPAILKSTLGVCASCTQ